jgi:Family of unknown function (DUF5330)
MSFIKLAFWLGVLVLLLPTDAQQQARVYSTAVATVERATTFCDRNARTCDMAAEAWAMFLKKAEFGARLVGDLITSQGRQNGPESPTARPQGPAGATSGAHGTLLPTDMEAGWRGPAARRTGG